jgi:hypothetical protein
MIAAIIVGHYSGRSQKIGLLYSLIISLIVVPLMAVFLSNPLYSLVTLYDWPNTVFVLPPNIVIWTVAALGGIVGIRSGTIWNQGEASCIYCLISVIVVLAGISLVVVLLP